MSRRAGLENLASAIIYRACLDYEDLLIKIYSETDEKLKKIKETRLDEFKRFFGSDWYYCLTNINHNALMREIQNKAQLQIQSGKRRENYQTLWATFYDGIGDDNN